MHARGIPPTGNVTINDVEDYCANFEKKMGSFLQPRADLTDEEAAKLGKTFYQRQLISQPLNFVMTFKRKVGRKKKHVAKIISNTDS